MTTSAKSKNKFPTLPRLALAESVGERGGRGSNAPAAFQSLPAWQQERCLKAHKICLAIEDRIRNGQTLDKAVRYFAAMNRNRYLQTDPARRVRFCKQTLLRLLYIWRVSGRTPQSLMPNYGRTVKITSLDIRAFLRAALRPKTTSFAQARNGMRASKATASGFWHALDETSRRGILRAFNLRREAMRLNKRAAEIFETLIDRLCAWG